MLFVYIDDFGHVGPYHSRTHAQYNTSPVFGFAGFALPEKEVRPFSTFFLQLKENVCKRDIEKAGRPVFRWEKKGTNFFTRKSIARYQSVREAGFRLFDEIRDRGGFVFYHGREKVRGELALNPVGLQTTVLAHAIRRIDNAAANRNNRFVLVMDQCSAKMELLDTAQKTMFGAKPSRQLVCPPFEVESYLDQNMQAADWIASLIGKVWAHRTDPEGFADCEGFNKYFGDRLHRVAHNSGLDRRDDLLKKSRAANRTLVKRTLIVEESLVVEASR